MKAAPRSPLSDAELVELHAELVRTPSISGEEGAAIGFAARFLERRGLAVERIGGSLLAWAGRSDSSGEVPLVLFDTHLDTVPVAPGWTRDPFGAAIEGERIYGLGANDAKASAAAMMSVLVGFAAEHRDFDAALALVREEETKSAGTAEVIAELARRGRAPSAVVVGEPTGLDLAIAQKGLLVLELVARGEAAHAAHARSLGVRNAATALARDLLAIDALEADESPARGPLDPLLGRATVTPTLLSGGSARNVVPAEARALLDCRTVPVESAEQLRARLAARLEGELVVLSDRLRPVGTDPGSALVRAAKRARPAAKLYGSATLSDMALFAGTPAIKVGPGDSARSHRPDEYVTVAELAEGAAFYARLLAELTASARDLAPRRAVSEVG